MTTTVLNMSERSVTRRRRRMRIPAKRESPSPAQQARALRFVRTEIDFIPNPSFHSPLAEEEILDCSYDDECRGDENSSALKSLPSHLTRLCAEKLLDAEEEMRLFRRMNYLKYRANALRAKLDPDDPDVDLLDRAEAFMEEAQAVRDRIVRANVRLVISVVKKFVTPQHSFDELFSDGLLTLFAAVDKFDYDRGYRFSTYAYRSIARNAYRAINDRRKSSQQFAAVGQDVLESAEEHRASVVDERAWESMRGRLSQMLKRLDQREQYIISGRYALGDDLAACTFQSLADSLGISKERVRQLAQRAVAKLQKMAAESPLDDLVHCSLA